MIKIDTRDIQVYGNRLLVPLPAGTSLETLNKAKRDGKYLHVEISVPTARKQRSLSANAMFWSLCQQLAVELSKNGPLVRKEDIYRREIKELFEPVVTQIDNEDVEYMKESWEGRGLGWICEDLGESTLYGKTRLAFYKGSSSFDTKQMSRLIDGIIQDCEAVGLEVLSEEERQTIINNWDTDRKQ